MRTFTERDGRSPFVGEHIIYDSVEEFKEKMGSEYPLKKWGVGPIEELKAGEWVIADDGFIVQVLRVKWFPNKNGSRTYFVRVPMGTFAVYFLKSRIETETKGWVWRQMMGQFGLPQKSSVGHRSRLFSPGKMNKIKFATLFLSGISMVKAVKIIYPNTRHLTTNQLLIKATNLMDDKVVQAELKDQVSKFKEDMTEKFSDKRIVSELDLLLERSKKGTDAHRCNIQFIMELRGMYTSQSSLKKNGKSNIQEANYTEVPPSEG